MSTPNPTTLHAASRQWASRPSDERFTSLLDMQEHFRQVRLSSRELIISSRKLTAMPIDGTTRELTIMGPSGVTYAPTHWTFGQLAGLADSPAGYLRELPAPIAADCINYGLHFKRPVADIGILLRRSPDGLPEGTMQAATGPRYGRVWNSQVVDALVSRFGDGITGDWRVPGEFSQHVNVTKGNTTLYASDRDMFVFLADEDHRIEIANRRDGEPGTLARGFFVWNSEVGASTLGIGTFLFDYACSNRIVWGAREYKEIRVRHSAGAPDRFIEEVAPALHAMSTSSTANLQAHIKAAQNTLLGDRLADFLSTRFGARTVPLLHDIHMDEEHRPIESLWDIATAVTAYARGIPNNDRRIELERDAGKVLDLANPNPGRG